MRHGPNWLLHFLFSSIMIKYVIALLLLVMPCVGNAQDSLQSRQLDELVFTGQYEPQSLSKSVYQIRTIPLETIQARGATTVQDLLNTELNFRFSQDMALGTSNITMNGLPGQYVKVLIDGVPMVGKSSGNEINLNQININSIERIEIVEGPMAVTFGADALAGVINVITKKAYDTKLSISARIQEETVGDEYGVDSGIHNQYVSAGYSFTKWYGKLEAGHNYFGGWTGEATGREKQWHPKTQWLGAGVVGYKNDKLNVYYRLDALNENIYNPGEFQGGQALDQRYITSRLMHQVQGDATLSDKLSYNGAVSFTDYYRKTQSVNVDEETGNETLSLGEGQQDKTTFLGFTARGTFQYKLAPTLSLQPGYDFNVESGKGGRLMEGTHTISDAAIFLSGEYTPGKIISIRPGFRTIHNSQYDAPPIVPSVNVKLNFSEKADLRVSYGRGFRAPALRELYFDFFDASHAIEGNPDLEPEYSNSFNGSFTWRSITKEKLSIQHVLTGFYNVVDNMITTGLRSGSGVTTYFNVANFKTQGTTLTAKLQYANLNTSVGFSYTGRYNEFEEESDVAFTWSPEANATVGYTVTKVGLSANLYYKYTGKLPYYETAMVNGEEVIHQAFIDPFHWMDVSVQKKFMKYFEATVGVRNLFNVVNIQNSTLNTGSAHSDGAVRPVGYGRSFFLTLNFQLIR